MIAKLDEQFQFILKKLRIEDLFAIAKNHVLIQRGSITATVSPTATKVNNLDKELEEFLMNY